MLRKEREKPSATNASLADFLVEKTLVKWEQGPPQEVLNLERYQGKVRQYNADGSPKLDPETGKQIVILNAETRADGALAFMREVTAFIPRPYQEDCVRRMYRNRRLSVRGPRGLGKSAFASNLILHFVAVNDICKCLTTASSWAQLEDFLWPEIHRWHSKADWEKIKRRPNMNLLDFSFGGSEDENIKPTATCFAIRADKPEKMEGAHSPKVLIVMDEAKAIEDPTFDALEGTLSKGDKYALVISTPGPPIGRFYMIQMQKPGYEDWDVKHVTKEEILEALEIEDDLNGRVGDERESVTYRNWIEQRRKQWGASSPMYLNHVEGEFADTGDDFIIPMDWIKEAQDTFLRWQDNGFRDDFWGNDEPPRVLGVDMAGNGKNRTAISKRIGYGIRDVETQPKESDTVEATKRVMVLTRMNPNEGKRFNTINIEADGLGTPIVDRMREIRRDDQETYNHVRIVPIVSGSKTDALDISGELGFFNKRAQMWWHARHLLDPANGYNVAIPPDEVFTARGEKTTLGQELSLPKWTEKGDKIYVESKDEIRKRLKGQSTDLADSVVISLFEESTPIVEESVRVTTEDIDEPHHTFYDPNDRWNAFRQRGFW